MQRNNAVKLALSVVAAIIFLYLAITEPIQGRILGVVLVALITWSLYPERHLESGLGVILLIAFFQASLNIDEFVQGLFTTYGGSGLWIILSGFVLAKGMEVSGLGRRVALRIATSMGCKPRNIILAIAATSLALSPLSPSTTAKAFLILPICVGLVEAFNVKKGSRFGSGVMLMAMAGNNIASTGFLTATVPNPISAQYLLGIGLSLSWVDWVKMAMPITISILGIAYIILHFTVKPEIEYSENTVEIVNKLRDSLGPFSRQELMTAGVFTVCLILWMTESIIPFNVGFLSFLVSLILLVPGFDVMNARGFSKTVPYGSIVLFAASLFLARAVGKYNALDPVAKEFFKLIGVGGLGPTEFLIGVVVLAMLLHVVFTSTTVYATVMIPIVLSLAELQGVNPGLVGLPVAFLAPIAVILPVNTIPNLVFYNEGWFTEKQIVMYGIVLSIASAILVLFIGIPYWRYLGLV
jgi:solute carrier family 13 (sodium-dependent dicarboxylate transporter), member 2/3/5